MMEEFQAYSPEEIILSNLEELLLRSLENSEQELAHLRELAAEIASCFADDTAFLASLPDHRLPAPEKRRDLPDHLAPFAEPLCRGISTRRRILLCMELRKMIPAPQNLWQDFFFPSGEELSSFSFNRISYQKNSYTELAYQRFSKLLGEARASYAHSFPSVCEDVYNGLSEYCILPIENSAEGRLSSFIRLISQYDLKIAATCDVKIGEDKVTRFALLRRSITKLRVSAELPQYYEFSCQLSEDPRAEDLLMAASLCGLTAESADIKMEKTSDSALHCVLRLEKGDLPAFLLYLAMEVPTANPIGLYPNLPL